ncbi:hypothetical protein [Streptomyces sp. NBC_01538]|uniref:hypothetical protein n=1 Tax=Streptomyces sp. NBC_01538 TaxID=2903897 RepID=UPI0038696E0F
MEQKLLVALVSAIIGASATLFAHFLKARAEPHKRISWESSTDPGFAAINDPEIKDKLSVTYGNTTVKNIYSIKYKVANSGNRVVKGQRIRFQFPQDTRVLESYLSPLPEPELKVERESTQRDGVTYSIGHLERKQEVQFRFVVAGDSAHRWKATPSNEEGDVEVERRGVAEKKEDSTHVKPFLISLFLLLTVPYALASPVIDEPIGDALSTVARFTFLIYALFHVSPVARFVRDAFSKAEPPTETYNAHAYDGSVAFGNLHGNLIYTPPSNGEQQSAK